MTGNVSFSSPLFHVIIDNIQHYTSQIPTLPAGDTMRAHQGRLHLTSVTQENAGDVHSLRRGP